MSYNQKPSTEARCLSQIRSLQTLWRALLLVLCFGAGGSVGAAPTEYEVKAAFLYHFAQFSGWPPQSFASSNAPLIIGIIGADPFGPSLDAFVKGEEVSGHSLVIKRLSTDNEISTCHILFVGRSEQNRVPALLKKLRGYPVLTVSEVEHFGEQGGIIHFIMEKGAVHFEINPAAAERAGLKINSKLLRVARIVEDTDS
jgi:hypothetical protein